MSNPPQRTPRSSQAVTPRSTGALPADVERALALRDVMDHAVRVQREITDPQRMRPSRTRPIWAGILCALAIGFGIYSWVARPEFIWGPAARQESPARREATLRFSMYLLARRLESYRAAAGGYPTSLSALNGGTEGITLHIVSDSVFELRATDNGRPIVFRSNEPASVFLGASPAILTGTQK